MHWGPSPRLMCVVGQAADGATAVHVCRKTLLQQCCRDGYVVIQVRMCVCVCERVCVFVCVCVCVLRECA